MLEEPRELDERAWLPLYEPPNALLDRPLELGDEKLRLPTLFPPLPERLRSKLPPVAPPPVRLRSKL